MTAETCPAAPVPEIPLGEPLTPADIQEIREELTDSPSDRDLEIHAIVQQEGLTQREAAERFQLSQPRICKILQSVDDWSASLGFDARGQRTPDQRRRLAEHIFRQRLDYFYSRAMRAWEHSQGDQSTSRILRTSEGVPQAMTRSYRSHGTPAYLMLALRIAERIARLDGVETGGPRRGRESTAEIRLSNSAPAASHQAAARSAQTPTAADVAASGDPTSTPARQVKQEVINRSRASGDNPLTSAELDDIFDNMLKQCRASA